MNHAGDARLRRLLGGDHLASLRRRLRQRFERVSPPAIVEHIRVTALTAEEHAALASLLGRKQRYARSLQIDVRRVDAALQRSGIATSLHDALERLDGPIVHPASARIRLQDSWLSVVKGCSRHDLIDLLQVPAGLGLLKRLARQDPDAATDLCRRTEAVLRHLPANGITRSQLAADILGDAHALDGGQAVASLVLAVWRRLDPRVDTDENLPVTSERARDTWARAGVLVNELARPVLFLNLPVIGAAEYIWRRGEPAYLSLRSLLRSPPPWDVANRTIYVCENPNLVAIAADRWGAASSPLMCTDGMPAAAQRCLLSQLAQAGALLCYHGDFDWPGLHIGNHLMRELGARPWRFGEADYLAAVRDIRSPSRALAGLAVEASWDAALTAAMQHYGIAVPEEALTATLLPDLNGVPLP